MRRLLFIVVVSLTIAMPLKAQDFDDVMARLEPLMAKADQEGISRLLGHALRRFEASGGVDPDFAIFYAMQTDMIRNVAKNPAYALQMAERGLALIAGNPDQRDFQSVLLVSRAYALADLGQFEAAAASARLLMPAYRAVFGDEYADGFARDAAPWSQGVGSAFNIAATTLARRTLDQAYMLFETESYGKVLALTGAAILPLGTELPEGDVRAINAEAEYLAARALFRLGRSRDSANGFGRALGFLLREPWQSGQKLQFWPDNDLDEGQRWLAFNLLTGRANAVLETGNGRLAAASLREAATLVRTSDERATLLLLQSGMVYRGGDAVAALAMLTRSRQSALVADDFSSALSAEFYAAIVAFQLDASPSGKDPSNLLDVTQRILEFYRSNQLPGRDFILQSAAKPLVQTTAYAQTLSIARKALQIRRLGLAQRDDSNFGRVQARKNGRETIELFLRAAYNGASNGLDLATIDVACPADTSAYGCIISQTRP